MNVSSIGINSVNTDNMISDVKQISVQESQKAEVVQKTKKQKNAEAVHRVQTEFLSQVGEGKTPREAFFDSLKAMEEPKENEDSFQKVTTEKNIAGALKYLTPDKIKPWLELIAFAIPIIKQIVDLFPNGDSIKPQEPHNQ